MCVCKYVNYVSSLNNIRFCGSPHCQLRIQSFSQETIISQAWARLLSSQHRRGHLIYLAISFLIVRRSPKSPPALHNSEMAHAGDSGLWLCTPNTLGQGACWEAVASVTSVTDAHWPRIVP